MFGQPASSQTVCRPSRFTRPLSSVYSGPIFALILIHGGLRSIGVSALRTSRRSSLRPSGWMAVTRPAYAVLGGVDQRPTQALRVPVLCPGGRDSPVRDDRAHAVVQTVCPGMS